MKKLRIIVPKDSALDFYLVNHSGFIFDKIVRLSNDTSYKMNISLSLQLIDFLVCKFHLKDFSIRCYHGLVTFRVRS